MMQNDAKVGMIKVCRYCPSQRLVCFLLLCVLFTAPHTSWASEQEIKIGFLKKGVVLETCQAMRDFKKKMDQLRKQSMAQLTVEENRLREEEQRLQQPQNALSSEELSQRKKAFDMRVHGLQKKTDFLKKQFQMAYLKGMETIQRQVAQVTEEYSRQQGYTLVLDHPVVMYGRAEDDLTQAIQSLMDQRLPQIEIVLPTEQELEMHPHGT